jgi:hypothetical protein
MSETRPPITAGPIERAFRFLKSTSVKCGGVGEGVGVTEDDNSAFGEGEAVGDGLEIGVLPDGVCSCAVKIEIDKIQANSAQKKPDRVFIGCRLYPTLAYLRCWKWATL